MKTVFLNVEGTNVATVPCPLGKRVKILSVACDNTANPSPRIQCEFRRDSVQFMVSCTEFFTAAGASMVCFAIGLSTNAEEASVIDPATGVVTYNTPFTMNAGLLDSELDFDVIVVVTATVLRWTIVYAVLD